MAVAITGPNTCADICRNRIAQGQETAGAECSRKSSTAPGSFQVNAETTRDVSRLLPDALRSFALLYKTGRLLLA
jgi:hypothetical protein